MKVLFAVAAAALGVVREKGVERAINSPAGPVRKSMSQYPMGMKYGTTSVAHHGSERILKTSKTFLIWADLTFGKGTKRGRSY